MVRVCYFFFCFFFQTNNNKKVGKNHQQLANRRQQSQYSEYPKRSVQVESCLEKKTTTYRQCVRTEQCCSERRIGHSANRVYWLWMWFLYIIRILHPAFCVHLNRNRAVSRDPKLYTVVNHLCELANILNCCFFFRFIGFLFYFIFLWHCNQFFMPTK